MSDQPLNDFFETNAWFRAFVAQWVRLSQWVGFDILPHHFYQPIPNLAELKTREWSFPKPDGFDLRLDDQVSFLRGTLAGYRDCFRWPQVATISYEFHLNNGFYDTGDAEILYSMIRNFKPRRVIELGSGYSTRLAAQAIRDAGLEGATELIAIEPFPAPLLRTGFPGLTHLMEARAQDVPIAFFDCLERNDILFIDSSHVIKTKNDVVFEYLQILPRLKPGVLVHIHDVFIPMDYPREWIVDHYKFWTEQYLLQAFLCFNRSFEVIWSGAAMALFHAQALKDAFPLWQDSHLRLRKVDRISTPTLDGRSICPSSFWIRRI